MEDSTNADTAYARNKLRRQVIPLLEELNPQVISRMADTVGCLRADNDYLTAQAMAAVRTAERDELLAVDRGTAVAAVAGLQVQDDSVDEEGRHWWDSPSR